MVCGALLVLSLSCGMISWMTISYVTRAQVKRKVLRDPIMIIPGIYQLRIRLRQPKVIRVGALGRHHFPVGWYIYTGSARSGLVQRIRRHLRQDKRKHWHIDYLLAVANDIEAFVLPDSSISNVSCMASSGSAKSSCLVLDRLTSVVSRIWLISRRGRGLS